MEGVEREREREKGRKPGLRDMMRERERDAKTDLGLLFALPEKAAERSTFLDGYGRVLL